MKPITQEKILASLDASVEGGDYNDFIDLGHAYFELANCRLTLFKKDNEWAIVFEKFGYNARAGTPVSIETSLFGNCLENLPELHGQMYNTNYIDVENDIYETIKKGGDSITIRGQKIAIPTDKQSYKNMGLSGILTARTTKALC